MIRALSKALRAVTVTADGARRRVACVGVRALVTAMLVAVPTLHAQQPVLELGFAYADMTYATYPLSNGGPEASFFSRTYAGLWSSVRLWSAGPVSLSGEASASVKVPGQVERACLDSPLIPCDSRAIGDVLRVGLTSRVGRRNGSGAYALVGAGWMSALRFGEVTLNGKVVERAAAGGDRIGGMTLGLGAGVPLPVGDRRTGIEVRRLWLGGTLRGAWTQLGLTRRW